MGGQQLRHLQQQVAAQRAADAAVGELHHLLLLLLPWLTALPRLQVLAQARVGLPLRLLQLLPLLLAAAPPLLLALQRLARPQPRLKMPPNQRGVDVDRGHVVDQHAHAHAFGLAAQQVLQGHRAVGWGSWVKPAGRLPCTHGHPYAGAGQPYAGAGQPYAGWNRVG